jgi:hypothetical protein
MSSFSHHVSRKNRSNPYFPNYNKTHPVLVLTHMKSYEKIQDSIIKIGLSIESEDPALWIHSSMKFMAEWQGADTIITSDFGPTEHGFLGHDLIVRTRHASAMTWLFFNLRDTFGDELDSGNKYRFYGDLAMAAIKHLSTELPEDHDPRPLMKAVLRQSTVFLHELQEDDQIADGVSVILHHQDSEGHQKRIDPETSEEVS